MDQEPGRHRSAETLAPEVGGLLARLRREAPLAVLDLTVALAAYLATLVFRFDALVPSAYWGNFWTFVSAALVAHLTNQLCGLYGPMWRYASVVEVRRIVRAGLLGGSGVVAANLLVELVLGGVRALPLSVTVFGAVLNLLGTGAIRFQSRLFAARQHSLEKAKHRVLVVGAGSVGSMMLRDLLNSPSTGLVPIGVVDDDRRKVGRRLHGIPVSARP